MNEAFLKSVPMQVLALALCSSASVVHASSYWDGVTRDLPVSPHGNVIAISCHNCYGSTNAATSTQVGRALGRAFDLIEFDLTRHADGLVYIEHDDSETASRGKLSEALAATNLKQSDRILFMEIKELYTTAATSDSMMLSILRLVRDGGYAVAGRPTVLRAFLDGNQRHEHLTRAKALLAQAEFATIRDHVRFHALVQSDVRNGIRQAQSRGFDGVELEYRGANLFGAIMQAKLLGLGVGVYTTPDSLGEVFLSAFREDIDYLTTDYDLAATARADTVRELVEDNTALVYLNTGEQTGYPVSYKRTGVTSYSVAAGSSTPGFELLPVSSDEDRVGGSLVFTGSQSITTWDADNDAVGGYFVTAVVNFDDLTSGATSSIVAKSDSGGFALELAGAQLRFGVYVGGSYRYATAPLGAFNGTQSYFIVGAYDGDGAVRLWVNNTERTASSSVTGGVGANNSPIVVGADPQGATDRRFFFQGKLQQAMVQRWRNH